jgi:hypothetical protein
VHPEDHGGEPGERERGRRLEDGLEGAVYERTRDSGDAGLRTSGWTNVTRDTRTDRVGVSILRVGVSILDATLRA